MPVKKVKVKKLDQKTKNIHRIRKSVKSDIQKVRRSTRSEFSESSGQRLGGSLSIDVYDTKGKVVGKTSLPKEIFAAKVNQVLMAQAVRIYLANQRKGTASTKTRGEVIATTAKIWRQKGTGRARHGAKSAPIWVGGGVVFGPKPRDFSLHLPKKMRRLALASSLTSQLKNKAIKIIDGLEKLEPKTKVMYSTVKTLTKNPSTSFGPAQDKSLRAGKSKKTSSKTLLVISGKVENIARGARNIEGVTIRPANLLTTYEVLNSNAILFMKDAIGQLLKEKQ